MKQIFIWQSVGEMTNYYCSGAGVCVVANNLEEALSKLEKTADHMGPPDFTAAVDSAEDKVFIFPDAGCC